MNNKNSLLTKYDIEDFEFLKPGTFAEIVNYNNKSSIPRNKPWMIVEYNSKEDTVKISSLSGKRSYRIESWRLSPIKFSLDKSEVNNMIGGFKDIDTDEE